MNSIKLIATGAMLLVASAATAASSYLFDNPENKTYLGVRAGLDISSAGNGGGYYSNKAGFSLGAVYDIPLWMNLYFEPGLSVFYNTFGTTDVNFLSVDRPVIDATTGLPAIGPDGPIVETDEVPYQIDGSIRNFGFRIPLMVGYHFDFTDDLKVHVFTGPQMNISLLARYHQNEVRVSGAEQQAESGSIFGTGGFKHIDFQWAFGAGVSYQNYYMSLSGAWGISQMKSSTLLLPRNLHRNIFSITLGYNF